MCPYLIVTESYTLIPTMKVSSITRLFQQVRITVTQVCIGRPGSFCRIRQRSEQDKRMYKGCCNLAMAIYGVRTLSNTSGYYLYTVEPGIRWMDFCFTIRQISTIYVLLRFLFDLLYGLNYRAESVLHAVFSVVILAFLFRVY